MTCIMVCRLWCFFFFKQKTAYEMRISDWSSDVCSSDLAAAGNGGEGCAGGSRETEWRAGGRIGGQGNILRPDQRSDALFEFQHGAGRGDREGRQHRPQTHRPVPGIEPRGGGTLAYGKERGPPGPAPRPGGDQAQEKVGAEEEATDRDDPTAPRAEQVVVEADEKAHDAGLVPERHIDD